MGTTKSIIMIILGIFLLVSSSWGILIYQSSLETAQKYHYGCFLYNMDEDTPRNETIDCQESTLKYIRMRNNLPIFRGVYLFVLFIGIMLVVAGAKRIKKNI